MAGAGTNPLAGVNWRNSDLCQPINHSELGFSDGSTGAGMGKGEFRSKRTLHKREKKSLRSCYTVRSNSSLGTCFRL